MRHTSLYLFVTAVSIAFASCQLPDTSKAEAAQAQAEKGDHPGLALMEAQCYSCHHPDAPHDSRLAPPMIAVKEHYMRDGLSEAQFAEAILHFLQEPTEEKSKMPGAVRRFGLMPKMAFNEDDIRQIAAYLYTEEVEEPDWFEEHRKEKHGGNGKRHRGGKGHGHGSGSDKGESPMTAVEKGKQMALATKAVLGKNLMGALQRKGTNGALSFCNIRAHSLTDSMAGVKNAMIKRVSDKNRNPQNAANAKQLEYIQQAKEQLANGEEIAPFFEEVDGQKRGFYPILTNQMCLQCHGEPGVDIALETMALIRDLYPEDQAVGYDVNALRGIWVVEWESEG